jgi:hypothetical protein
METRFHVKIFYPPPLLYLFTEIQTDKLPNVFVLVVYTTYELAHESSSSFYTTYELAHESSSSFIRTSSIKSFVTV